MIALFLILALGLVNWFGTLLIVESEFFRPLRDWVLRREIKARRRLTIWFWHKTRYLINCHMCTGTWVGMLLVPWAPMVFGSGFFAYVITGLLIKALGHGTLVLHKWGEAAASEHKNAAMQLGAPPEEDYDDVRSGGVSIY